MVLGSATCNKRCLKCRMNPIHSTTLEQRYLGCLLGLACGDAVGTTVEFRSRGSFQPLTDMVGGGPFRLLAGQWTDDTSMALCLAESLIQKQGFDARDQMARYLNWYKHGYWSSTGDCFDIGMAVRKALEIFEDTGEVFAGSTDTQTAGNGALMRMAPVVMNYFPHQENILNFSIESTRTTHQAPEALECSKLFAWVLMNALKGIRDVLFTVDPFTFKLPNVQRIAMGGFNKKTIHEIRGTGYCVDSLEASLWCFHHSTSFESAVLMAANLGDDADTTAAIVGQIAGAYYGVDAIPNAWLEKLHARADIEVMAKQLHLGKSLT